MTHTIQVLGTGCRRCDALYASAKQAVAEAGVDCQIQKITDVVKMIDFGIIALPALAIDGKVVAMGTVPTPAEIGRYLVTT